MFIYILSYYIFRNTPSTSVNASPVSTSSLNYTLPLPVSLASFAAQTDGPTATRSLLNIIWSCVATLFLCTWSSVHPNIPAPDDEWWIILWRRLKTVYWALVAPEVVLTWAVRQRFSARDILREYKHIHPNWTYQHAHFLQMGGFHLRHTNQESKVLYPGDFYAKLESNEISLPLITAEEIEDKSKADALTKSVVILQTLWFVIQCIGRHAQGLALTPLEVSTLAVISCTFMLSIVWWDKPFDANQPIYLDLKSSHRPESSQAAIFSEEERKHEPTFIRKIFTSIRSLFPITLICKTVRGEVMKELERSDSGFIHMCFTWTIFGPISYLYGYHETKQERRVGLYYSYRCQVRYFVLVPFLSAAIFSLVHYISWHSNFPTTIERVLWRISTVGIGSFPIVYGFLTILEFRVRRTPYRLDAFDIPVAHFLFPVYIFFRYYLLLEAFLSLRALPQSAFQTIEWSDFLPHF